MGAKRPAEDVEDEAFPRGKERFVLLRFVLADSQRPDHAP
jgi:hypothetical protein